AARRLTALPHSALGRSGSQERSEVLGSQPRLAETRENPIERGESDPPGCRDLDSDRLALGVVVDQEARRRLRYPCRPLGSASREVEIGSDRPPLAERHLEVPTSHDLLLPTTG